MFVRISKGRYKPELHAEVTARLSESAKSLVPAIKAMPGCMSYYVGSEEASSVVFHSVWNLSGYSRE